MKRLLITGAAGAVGTALLSRMAQKDNYAVIATDIREPVNLPPNARFIKMDVTSSAPHDIIMSERPDTVVHLASIVTPGPDTTRDLEYQVDVEGTRKVLDAAISAEVKRLGRYVLWRGLWLSRRQSCVIARNGRNSRQSGIRVFLAQKTGRGDVGRSEKNSPGIRASRTAGWDGSREPYREPDNVSVPKASPTWAERFGEPLCLHMGQGPGRNTAARIDKRACGHFQRLWRRCAYCFPNRQGHGQDCAMVAAKVGQDGTGRGPTRWAFSLWSGASSIFAVSASAGQHCS